MTPQELKESILTRAVQGKLVEQRKEEGAAAPIIKKIRDEKDRLIKENKIKKESVKIDESEGIPFDIPDSWEWVRLYDICKQISDGTHKTPSYVDKGKPFLSVKDISSGYMDFSKIKYISEEEHKKLLERCKPERNDILVCRIGTLGKALRIDTDIEFTIFVSLGLIKLIDSEMADFIVMVINSGYGFKWIQEHKVGGGTHTNKINLDVLRSMYIPIPPIAEQKRIVSKIEELLPLVDRYEKAWTKLEDFNRRFPVDMQKSILQLAIEGKLVEQRPEEGTGEELYQQIQAEKQKLIKEGKIKKEKPLPEITEDEIPFEIPESWRWVYIGDVFQHNTGKAQNSSGNQKGVIRKFITTSNLYWNKFDFSKIKEMPFTEQELERCSAHKGDLLVCEGGDFGRAAIWNYDEDVCIQNHVHRLRPYLPVSIEYFYYIFYLYKNSGRLKGQGVAIQGLSSQAMHKILVPLPSLAEQKRIVAKIEELLPLCERLK